MKRKLLATMLTIATIASLVGCGKTTNEPIAEAPVEEITIENGHTNDVVSSIVGTVEDTIEDAIEDAKPAMVVGETRNADGALLDEMRYIPVREDGNLTTFTHCMYYSWRSESVDENGEYTYTNEYSDAEPCEFDENFTCTKCGDEDYASICYESYLNGTPGIFEDTWKDELIWMAPSLRDSYLPAQLR